MQTFIETDGASWTRKTGWMNNQDHCSWEEITCSQSTRVAILALQNNNLSDAFPSKLNNLNSLQALNI